MARGRGRQGYWVTSLLLLAVAGAAAWWYRGFLESFMAGR